MTVSLSAIREDFKFAFACSTVEVDRVTIDMDTVNVKLDRATAEVDTRLFPC
jgi:hypothetical protein